MKTWSWIYIESLLYNCMQNTWTIFCILRMEFVLKFSNLLQRFYSTPWLHSAPLHSTPLLWAFYPFSVASLLSFILIHCSSPFSELWTQLWKHVLWTYMEFLLYICMQNNLMCSTSSGPEKLGLYCAPTPCTPPPPPPPPPPAKKNIQLSQIHECSSKE